MEGFRIAVPVGSGGVLGLSGDLDALLCCLGRTLTTMVYGKFMDELVDLQDCICA